MRCTYTLSSGPPSGSGAIAILDLHGEIDQAFAALGIRAVAPGQAVLRVWPKVDTVVVSRLSPTHAMVFPHGGLGVFQRVQNALSACGIALATLPDPQVMYPEARSLVEARMLAAIAKAASPLALDLLLAQPQRWARGEHNASLVLSAQDSAILNRLIHPPLVVALGPPNIGKSSLLNALAGRTVAIVADAPGTTRDHVGVHLDLAGLVVRYVDTPGIGSTIADQVGAFVHASLDLEAQGIALDLARVADLILLCSDPGCACVDVPADAKAAVVRVGLRSDLGPPASPADVEVSVRKGQGLVKLTHRIREVLVPQRLLDAPQAWTFW